MTKTEAIKIVRKYFPKAKAVKQFFNESSSLQPIPVRIFYYEIFTAKGHRFAWPDKTPDAAWIHAAESILKHPHLYPPK